MNCPLSFAPFHCIALQREKEASGLADVPGGAKGKLLEVEYAFTEDKKLRGQLRDANAIEAQVRRLPALLCPAVCKCFSCRCIRMHA
jgi:hypothetical protein